MTTCGNPGCRCQPPQLHGPYWQWTTAVAGKTVTRRLTQAQYDAYAAWLWEPPARPSVADLNHGASESSTLVVAPVRAPRLPAAGRPQGSPLRGQQGAEVERLRSY